MFSISYFFFIVNGLVYHEWFSMLWTILYDVNGFYVTMVLFIINVFVFWCRTNCQHFLCSLGFELIDHNFFVAYCQFGEHFCCTVAQWPSFLSSLSLVVCDCICLLYFVSGHKKAFFAAAVILGLIALLPFLLLLLPGSLNPLNNRRWKSYRHDKRAKLENWFWIFVM